MKSSTLLLLLVLAVLLGSCSPSGEHAPVTTDSNQTEPATDVPVTEQETGTPTGNVTDMPATDTPVSNPPATDAPVTDAPVTDAPATEPPVTDAPTTEPPVTDPPETKPHEHTWAAWQVTKAAGCTEKGTETRTCEGCGETQTRSTDAVGHHYGAWTVKTAASCEKTGTETRTCAGCGDTESRSIAQTGHTLTDWRVTTAATCAKAGTEMRLCSACGKQETRSLAMIAHSMGNWETVRVSCTEKGLERRTCTGCGKAEERTTAPTGSHTWGEWETVVAQQYCQDGLELRACQLCPASETRVVPGDPNNHDYEVYAHADATCKADGYDRMQCRLCGDVTSEVLPATGEHDFQYERTRTPERDCLPVIDYYRCTTCGDADTVEHEPKEEHDIDHVYYDVEPTATKPGTGEGHCAACQKYYDVIVPPCDPMDKFGDAGDGTSQRSQKDHYITIDFYNTKITIKGKLDIEGLKSLTFRAFVGSGHIFKTTIEVSQGELFTIEENLRDSASDLDLQFYIETDQVQGQIPYFVDHVWAAEGPWSYWLDHDGSAWSENRDLFEHFVDPQTCLGEVSSAMKKKSDEIVGSVTDPYEQMRLLNRWVATNITFVRGGTNDAQTALSTGKASGAGIAALLIELLRAQDIPAFAVDCFTIMPEKDGDFSDLFYATEANHKFVQAYWAEDDRWVNMDPAFDTESGVYLARFFDMSPDYLSFTHRIIRRMS